MAGLAKHNWKEIYEDVRRLVSMGEVQPVIADLALHLGIPRSTLQHGLKTYFGVRAKDLENLPPLSNFNNLSEAINPPSEEHTNEITETRVSPNLIVLKSKRSEVVQTLEDLLAAAEVDQEIWDVSKHEIKTWSVPMRVRQGTGKDGRNRPDQPVQVPIFYVAAWLVRKSPIATLEPVRPVDFPVRLPVFKKPEMGKASQYLVLADAQFGFSRHITSSLLTPYHDWRALDVIDQIIQANEFQGVKLAGDWLDLAAFSNYATMPEFRNTTQLTLIEARYWISKFGADEWVQGNHERRLEKAVHGHTFEEIYGVRRADMLELPPVTSLEFLIGMDSLNMKYRGEYPDNEIWLDDYVRIIHGNVAKAKPGHTASAIVEKSHTNVVFAHVHRWESAMRRLREGRSDESWIMALCPGCLCHVDGRVPGSSRNSQWSQGFAVVETDGKGQVRMTHVPIVEGQAIYNGNIYRARDIEGDMRDLHADAIRKIEEAERNL